MQLKPVLGPVQLVFYSVGVIIGAGIYSVIGSAAGLAQQSLWLSFVVGAVVALLTGFSYAEMTTSYPQAGAEYLYLRRALPRSDFASFGVGLVLLLGGAAAAATVAVAFGGYLRAFVDVPTGMSAFILLIVCTAFNIFGLRELSWVNMVFTCVEVAGLLLVIAAGLTRADFTEFASRAATTGHPTRRGDFVFCLSRVRIVRHQMHCDSLRRCLAEVRAHRHG